MRYCSLTLFDTVRHCLTLFDTVDRNSEVPYENNKNSPCNTNTRELLQFCRDKSCEPNGSHENDENNKIPNVIQSEKILFKVLVTI